MGMSRSAFWGEYVGIVGVDVASVINDAYLREEERIWRQNTDSNPHGAPWHTSFHASSFPGDDPDACGRRAVYELMDVPDFEPISPRLRGWFDLGKNHELEWVRRLAADGRLLSADQTAGDQFQTGFVDAEYWLTGSPDVIMLLPFEVNVHPVEIKTTSHEKVLAMKGDNSMVPRSHRKYLYQLRTYIGFMKEQCYSPSVTLCRSSWSICQQRPNHFSGRADWWCPVHQGISCELTSLQLQPPEIGTLIYASREDPTETVSYLVSYDAEFMATGRAQLARWQQDFLDGKIPVHPRDSQRAKWSVDPCQYCKYKRLVCKPDYTRRVTDIDRSHLVEFTRSVRPAYDPQATRQAVLSRWTTEEETAAA